MDDPTKLLMEYNPRLEMRRTDTAHMSRSSFRRGIVHISLSTNKCCMEWSNKLLYNGQQVPYEINLWPLQRTLGFRIGIGLRFHQLGRVCFLTVSVDRLQSLLMDRMGSRPFPIHCIPTSSNHWTRVSFLTRQ